MDCEAPGGADWGGSPADVHLHAPGVLSDPELRGGGAAHRGPELAREPAPGTPLYKGKQFGKAADAPS